MDFIKADESSSYFNRANPYVVPFNGSVVDLRTLEVRVRTREDMFTFTIERELKTIRLAARAVQGLGIERPRVAVAGVNPHAGENGLFGDEEAEIIAPAVAKAQIEGIDASGPWPGDAVFRQAREGRFDIVIAQLKLLGAGKA